MEHFKFRIRVSAQLKKKKVSAQLITHVRNQNYHTHAIFNSPRRIIYVQVIIKFGVSRQLEGEIN